MDTVMTQPKQALSAAQIDQYWQDGFLFPLDVMSPAEAGQWRGQLEDMEQAWGDVKLPRALNTYKRVNSQCVMPFAYQMATLPGVLDIVEGILGPNILIYAAEFFIKEPNSPQIVSMHQDLTYWGLGATENLVTAWIALSPATTESGCMQFAAGSHKNPILPHHDSYADNNLLSRGQEVQADIADKDRTDIVLQPGQMSLHHGLTIHGSGPNSSSDRRIGFVVRYINPDVMQEVAETDYAMIVRGADIKRNFINYAPPSGLFAERDLKLYEDMREAQRQAMMKGATGKSALYS